MNFEKVILKLTPYFVQNNFSIAETFNGYIRYESKQVGVALAYDHRDNSITVFLGHKSKWQVELSEDTLSKFFNDDSKISNDNFLAANLIKFFNEKGNRILRGDIDVLSRLLDFSKQASKEYTDDLVLKQNLRAADEAWQQKNYLDFLHHLDKIERSLLPQTYLTKYSYAMKKRTSS